MRRLVILGAGGHGRILAEIAELSGWEEIVFLDPKWKSQTHSGIWPVLDNDCSDVLRKQPEFSKFIVGIGDNAKRAHLHDNLERLGLPIASLVHPKAVVSNYAEIAEGCVVSAGAVINIGSKVERGSVINTNASVDHDCAIGPFCHIAPGAHLAADVTLCERAFIGLGACVRNGIHIMADAVVGAGATVVSTVGAKQIVIGTPARPLNTSDRQRSTTK